MMFFKICAGGFLGFIYFVLELESDGMTNVWIRNNKFEPKNIIAYVANPFQTNVLWINPELWRYNWIITSSVGALIYYGLF